MHSDNTPIYIIKKKQHQQKQKTNSEIENHSPTLLDKLKKLQFFSFLTINLTKIRTKQIKITKKKKKKNQTQTTIQTQKYPLVDKFIKIINLEKKNFEIEELKEEQTVTDLAFRRSEINCRWRRK